MARKKYEAGRTLRSMATTQVARGPDYSGLARATQSRTEAILGLVDGMKQFTEAKFLEGAKKSAAKIALENDPLKVITETEGSMKIVDKLAFTNSLGALQNNTIDAISREITKQKFVSLQNGDNPDVFKNNIDNIVSKEFEIIKNSGFDSPLFELELRQKMQNSLSKEIQSYEMTLMNNELKKSKSIQQESFKKSVSLSVIGKDNTELNNFIKNNPEYQEGGSQFDFATRYVEDERYQYVYNDIKSNIERYNDRSVIEEKLSELYNIRDNDKNRPNSPKAFDYLLNSILLLENKSRITDFNYADLSEKRKNRNANEINLEQQADSSTIVIQNIDQIDDLILQGKDKSSIAKMLQQDPVNTYTQSEMESYERYWDKRENDFIDDTQGYVLSRYNINKNIINPKGNIDINDFNTRYELSKQTNEFFTDDERNTIQSYLDNNNIDPEQKESFLKEMTNSIPEEKFSDWLSTLVKNIDNDKKKLDMAKFGLTALTQKRTKKTGIAYHVDRGAKILRNPEKDLSPQTKSYIDRVEGATDSYFNSLPTGFTDDNEIFIKAIKENTLNYVMSASYGADPQSLIKDAIEMFLGQSEDKTQGVLDIKGHGIYMNYSDADPKMTEEKYEDMLDRMTEEEFIKYGAYISPNGVVTKATELPFDVLVEVTGVGRNQKTQPKQRPTTKDAIINSIIKRDDQRGDQYFMFVVDKQYRTALSGVNGRYVLDYKAARKWYLEDSIKRQKIRQTTKRKNRTGK